MVWVHVIDGLYLGPGRPGLPISLGYVLTWSACIGGLATRSVGKPANAALALNTTPSNNAIVAMSQLRWLLRSATI